MPYIKAGPNARCFVCQSARKLERHRVIPGKAGGKYTKDNCVWLCKFHHDRVHAAIFVRWGRDYRKLNIEFLDYMSIIVNMLIEHRT